MNSSASNVDQFIKFMNLPGLSTLYYKNYYKNILNTGISNHIENFKFQ